MDADTHREGHNQKELKNTGLPPFFDQLVRNGKVIFSADDDAREWYEVSVLHRATDFKFQRYQALGV